MTDTNALIEQLAKDSIPVKQLPHPYVQCLKWLAGLAIYVIMLLMFFNPRPDLLVKLHSVLFLAETGTLALIAITTALSAALLSYPDLMQKKLLAYGPAGSFILFLVVMALAWRADTPPAPQPQHEMICTLLLTGLALLPAIWIFTTMRKSASTHSGIAGITATLCAFSIAALTLRLAEYTDSIRHVVTWHYLPMLALSILGLWLGKITLKW